jgi:hypothetical protein
LAHQEIDRLRVKCDQEPHIGPIVFPTNRPKASNQRPFVGDRYTSQFLKFRQLAQRDFAPRVVLIASYVIIVGAVDEKADRILGTEPNQFSERRLYGLRVLEPDYDVCVYE